jgi:hypothetical protein
MSSLFAFIKHVSGSLSATIKAKLNNMSTEGLPADAVVPFYVQASDSSYAKAASVSVAGLAPANPKWYSSYDWIVPTNAPAGTLVYKARIWIGGAEITYGDETYLGAPIPPAMTVETVGTDVTISWVPVNRARGYTVSYVPYPDGFPIYSFDIGSRTSF